MEDDLTAFIYQLGKYLGPAPPPVPRNVFNNKKLF